MVCAPMRVGLMCRLTFAKWFSVKMPTMPTTTAVIMIFTTVKSWSRSWPIRTLYFATPPFCRRKPKARPKRIAVTIFFPLGAFVGRLARLFHCFAGIDHRTV